MKTLNSLFSVLLLVILASSCRKTDFLEENAAIVPPSINASVSDSLTVSTSKDSAGWRSSADWKVAAQESFSVYYLHIADEAITADVVNNGLVLVFKQNDNLIAGLPVDEKTGSGNQYWYHQVSEGSLLISADTYGTAKAPDASKAIRYFIAGPEKLAELQKRGYSVDGLMKLNYEEATALF